MIVQVKRSSITNYVSSNISLDCHCTRRPMLRNISMERPVDVFYENNTRERERCKKQCL